MYERGVGFDLVEGERTRIVKIYCGKEHSETRTSCVKDSVGKHSKGKHSGDEHSGGERRGRERHEGERHNEVDSAGAVSDREDTGGGQ